MAVFGADDSETEIKRLKGLVSGKDHQINTLINEQHKKDELFDEERRAKQDALHKLQVEADRAIKAEKLLRNKTAELSSALMKLSNLESTLVASQAREKRDEKEIGQLQYELDSMRDGSSKGSANTRINETHIALQAQIKQLESTLARSESEKETLKAEKELGDLPGFKRGDGSNDRSLIFTLETQLEAVRRENVKLMEESRTSGTRDGDGRAQQLEAEVQLLREQLESNKGPAELETMKNALGSLKRESLKLENEKIAIERSKQKEVEALQSKLEDVIEELDDWRANAKQSSGKEELEKAKKVAQAALNEVTKQLDRSNDEVSQLRKSIESLEKKLREREEAEMALKDEIKRLNQHTGNSSSDDESLQNELRELRQRLKEGDAAPTVPSGSNVQLEKQIRQLQREIVKVNKEKEAIQASLEENDDLLAEKDEEILKLRSKVPLPETRAPSPAAYNDDFEKSELRAKLRKCEEEIKGLDRELAEAYEQLEDSKMDLRKTSGDFAIFKAEHEAFVESRASFDKDFDAVKADLGSCRQHVCSLTSALEAAESAKAQAEAALSDNAGAIDRGLAEIEALKSEIITRTASAEDLENQLTTLQATLKNRNHDDTYVAALKAEKESALAKIDELSVTVNRLEIEECGARQQVITTEEAVQVSREELKIVKDEMEKLKEMLSNSVLELGQSESELDRLRHQVEEMESDAANRSTDSQARERDALAFDMQQEITDLKKQVIKLEQDLEVTESMKADVEVEARRAHSQLQEDAAKLRSDLKKRQQQVIHVENQIALLRREKVHLEERVTAMTADLAAAQVHGRMEEPDMSMDMDGLQRIMEFAEDERQAQIASHSETIAAMESQISRLHAERSKDHIKIASLEQDISRVQGDLSVLDMSLQETVQAKTEAEDKLKSATEEVAAREAEVKDLQQQRSDWILAPTEGGLSVDYKTRALQNRVEEVEGRVARRNQQIALEQNKIRKLELNLALAEESISEQADRSAELLTERYQLIHELQVSERAIAFSVIELVKASALVATYRARIGGLHLQIEQRLGAKDAAEKELNALKVEREATEELSKAEISRLQDINLEKSANVENLNRRLADLKIVEADLLVAEQTVRQLQTEQEMSSKEATEKLQATKSNVDVLKAELVKAQDGLQTCEDRLTSWDDQHKAMVQAFEEARVGREQAEFFNQVIKLDAESALEAIQMKLREQETASVEAIRSLQSKLQERKTVYEAQIAGLQEQVGSNTVDLDLQQRLSDVTSQYEQLQHQQTDLVEILERAKSEKHAISEKLETLDEEFKANEKRLVMTEAAGSRSEEKVRILEGELSSVRMSELQMDARLREVEAQLRLSEDLQRVAENDVAILRADLHKASVVAEELRGRWSEAEAKLQEADRDLRSMDADIQRRMDSEAANGAKMDLLRQMLEESESAKTAAINRVSQLEQEKSELEQDLADQTELAEAMETQLNQQNNDLEEQADEVRAIKKELNALQRKAEKLERKNKSLIESSKTVEVLPPPSSSVLQPTLTTLNSAPTHGTKRGHEEDSAYKKEPQAVFAPAPYDKTPSRDGQKAFTPRRTPKMTPNLNENAARPHAQLPTKFNVFGERPAEMSRVEALRARLTAGR